MTIKSIWLRRIHKWVGLVIGLQFLIWAISGTAMALLDMEEVAGGTVAHLYVRLDPVAGDPGPADVGGVGRVRARARRARCLPDRLRRTWKRGLHAWKDSLERGTTT